MARTDNFRAQHKEIAAAVSDVEKLLDPAAAGQKAAEISKLLVVLSGKITFHLGMEDKYLYPLLQGSNAPNLKAMADEYIKDMGSLAGAFKDYMASWSFSKRIEENSPEFITQTKAVFAALKKRIEREESDLYPLADKL